MSSGAPAGIHNIPLCLFNLKGGYQPLFLMLKFHPKTGTILACDFGTDFKEPEMVKMRPVIVVSPNFKHRTGLCGVVPLSTTIPAPVEPYHCELHFARRLPPPFDSERMWVKGDMLYTVGFHRMHLLQTPRDQYGKRKYLTPRLEPPELQAVHKAVLNGLGLGRLTPHL